MKESVLGVIPARLDSSRLPRKPLFPILGRPLLQWVWERVSPMALFEKVVVATDSAEVVSFCESIGAPVILTAAEHPSGTDRVAEVARRPEFHHLPIVVNVQGDEPLVRESDLEQAVGLVREEGWNVGTCATPLVDADARRNPSVVKVARATSGRALYFSRAAIPHRRDGKPTPEELAAPPYLRHIGVYAYRREALLRWVSLAPSPLEKMERLEQLRALEDGIAIGVAVVDEARPGVDTAADALKMEELLSRMDEPLIAAKGP